MHVIQVFVFLIQYVDASCVVKLEVKFNSLFIIF